MQQFIPFDDQWDELAAMTPQQLVPYHVDVPCERALAPTGQGTATDAGRDP